MITLPKEKLPVSRTTPKLLLLYGEPKCGKTTQLAKLDDCLIIDCDPIEGGSKYIEAKKIVIEQEAEKENITKLAAFNQVIQLLIQQKKPYKYVAIDTITSVEEWLIPEATRLYKSTTQGKNFTGDSVLVVPYTGYEMLRMAFGMMMRETLRCTDNLIIVAHYRDKFLSRGKDLEGHESGGKMDTNVSAGELDLTGKIRRIIAKDADAIGYMYRTVSQAAVAGQVAKQKLRVTFKSNEVVSCGVRCPYLDGQDFEFDWSKIYPLYDNP